MKEVKITEKKLIFDDFFKIEEAVLQYERFDGVMSPEIRRLNFERGDSVAAIVYNRDRQKVILTKQFRFPTYAKGPGWIVEAVAGIQHKSESYEEAMRREILEELGYQCDDLEMISSFYLSPGGSSERIVLFYAEVEDQHNIEAGGGVASEGEDIQIVEWSRDELQELMRTNQIQDAKTMIGVQYFLHTKTT